MNSKYMKWLQLVKDTELLVSRICEIIPEMNRECDDWVTILVSTMVSRAAPTDVDDIRDMPSRFHLDAMMAVVGLADETLEDPEHGFCVDGYYDLLIVRPDIVKRIIRARNIVSAGEVLKWIDQEYPEGESNV